MGLTSTAALISVQDASGAVSNQANGATALVTPGTTVNLALQSTTGVAIWNIQFNCPNYPSLHQRLFEWRSGQANLIQVPLPVDSAFLSYVSTVSDGQASVQYASGTILTKGSNSVPVQHVARLATVAALAAYTNVNGVLTENANGALATIDSVAPAVGDMVLLTMGAAGADNGLYQVVSLGGASAKWVLQLAPDWAQGSLLLSGTTIEVTEGTVFGPSTWKVMTTGTSTVGTTAVAIYPRLSNGVTGAGSASVAATVAGSTPMFIWSATQSYVAVTQNTSGGTAVAQIPTLTAGVPGTAKVSLAIGGSDSSKYNCTVMNF